MKKLIPSFLVGSAAILVTAIACNQRPADTAEASLTSPELISRGAYLVTAMGCDDCHSPKSFGPQGPELDTSRRLSGRPANQPLPSFDTTTAKSWVLMAHDLTAAVGPWGISFAANLTSDETGIGSWSLDQFVKSLREGKYKGMDNSRPLLPPMPWQNYRNLNDDDLKAIFAFLKSTKPVENRVPAPIPPGGN